MLSSYDLLIKKPLIKKNIGTPGNKCKNCKNNGLKFSTLRCDIECEIATSNAAKSLIKSKLFTLKMLFKIFLLIKDTIPFIKLN